MGRGGSDTTAALIAAAMKADRCDIYTDVEAIFTADPRIIPNAKKIKAIDLLEMLELVSSGAKILHPRTGELVMRYKIAMRVLATFSRDTEGKLITSKDINIENRIINSNSSNKNLLKISLKSTSLSFLQVANMITQNHNHVEFMQEIKNNEEQSFITNLTDKIISRFTD